MNNGLPFILIMVQFLGMIIAPIVITSNVHDKETEVVWSCFVIALLFIGVSICSLATVKRVREPEGA